MERLIDMNPHEFIGLFCRCGDPVPESALICDECRDPICTACRAVSEDRAPDTALHVSCEENRNERAYERQCESFYGGSSPQTMAEYVAAARRVT